MLLNNPPSSSLMKFLFPLLILICNFILLCIHQVRSQKEKTYIILYTQANVNNSAYGIL